MSILTLEAKLERQDSTTPWGFRMQGGKDFSSPITIARVNPGSLAAKCGLQQGDMILKIGSKSSDTLKHKEAQDTIMSYGNKLDLLLQRGGAPTAQTYDKFSTPTIGSYQNSTGSGSGQVNSTFNATPKSFGSSKPAPYNATPAAPPPPPAVDNLTQQTSSLNINTNYAANKYSDVEEKPGFGSHQSRSFKFLQDTLDSGQDPPAALRPTVDLRRSPSPSNITSNVTMKQFNSPAGLYSTSSIQKAQPVTLVPADKSNGEVTSGGVEERKYDAQGKRLYTPSETFKLIQEQENPQSEQPEKAADVKQTRTIRVLEKQLGEDNLDVEVNSGLVTSKVKMHHPSETFQLIHERELRAEKSVLVKPEQSSTFKSIERQLGDGQQPSPVPAPAPAPVKTNTAPKPGVWSPGQPSHQPAAPAPIALAPAAPAPKPFTPIINPLPPTAAPKAAPSKPTGVGAVRGKMGDAVMKKSEAGLVPVCASCGCPIRGPFVTAMGKSWCPDHFICANPRCGNKLVNMGFVEEGGFLYCEKDYELYFAPKCSKCDQAIVGECVNALSKQYHPACFLCDHCKQPIGGTQFHLEDGKPYCENDWRQLYQTMCFSCNFPIEPGDKWVEALNSNFHSECFNCSTCQVNLEGQAFYAKSGKPYCKKHAR